MQALWGQGLAMGTPWRVADARPVRLLFITGGGEVWRISVLTL
jgi:hypothetical protein